MGRARASTLVAQHTDADGILRADGALAAQLQAHHHVARDVSPVRQVLHEAVSELPRTDPRRGWYLVHPSTPRLTFGSLATVAAAVSIPKARTDSARDYH